MTLFDLTGKKALVTGRLAKRITTLGMKSYGEYFRLLAASPREGGEWQTALDLLTTNETSFFREPQHFEFLGGTLLAAIVMQLPQHPAGIFVVMVLRPAVAGLEAGERLAVWRRVLPKFFPWVAGSIVLLVITGIGALLLYYGELFGAGVHIDVMILFAIVMAAFYLYVLVLPWRGFRKAFDRGDFAVAATQLERIRVVVVTNLGLGLATSFIGAAGTFLSH